MMYIAFSSAMQDVVDGAADQPLLLVRRDGVVFPTRFHYSPSQSAVVANKDYQH